MITTSSPLPKPQRLTCTECGLKAPRPIVDFEDHVPRCTNRGACDRRKRRLPKAPRA